MALAKEEPTMNIKIKEIEIEPKSPPTSISWSHNRRNWKTRNRDKYPDRESQAVKFAS